MEYATLIGIFKTYAASVLGAFLGAWHSDSKTWRARLAAVVFGFAVSHYGGEAIIYYWKIDVLAVQNALRLGLGLFGMRLVDVVAAQIGPSVRALRVKIIGNDPDSKKGDL